MGTDLLCVLVLSLSLSCSLSSLSLRVLHFPSLLIHTSLLELHPLTTILAKFGSDIAAIATSPSVVCFNTIILGRPQYTHHVVPTSKYGTKLVAPKTNESTVS